MKDDGPAGESKEAAALRRDRAKELMKMSFDKEYDDGKGSPDVFIRLFSLLFLYLSLSSLSLSLSLYLSRTLL